MQLADGRRVVQARAYGLRSPCGSHAGVAVVLTVTGGQAGNRPGVTLHFFVQCDGDVFQRDVQDLALSQVLARLRRPVSDAPVPIDRPDHPQDPTGWTGL